MNTKNLKPLDLEAALKGEPVMLRDGTKAFIRHRETEFNIPYPLIGVVCKGQRRVFSWTLEGLHVTDCQAGYDIIGMWPKTRIINGFEVPEPVREEPKMGDSYFRASFLSEDFHEKYHWIMDSYDFRLLERGLVFLNAEYAIATAKAILGINPYEDSEE